MRTFAERLKIAIEKKGMSQSMAARICGISQQSMNYIISNNLTSSKLAPRIASALDINPEWLMYGRGRFEETKIYELQIIHNPYMLIKFLNNDIDANSVRYTAIDIDLGESAFAYIIEPKKMMICSSSNKFSYSEYLTLKNSIVEITKRKKKISFGIFEWRSRYVDF